MDEVAKCGVETEQYVKLNTAVVQSFLDQVQNRIKEGDPEDLRLLVEHVVSIDFDLKAKTGQLKVQLPFCPMNRTALCYQGTAVKWLECTDFETWAPDPPGCP